MTYNPKQFAQNNPGISPGGGPGNNPGLRLFSGQLEIPKKLEVPPKEPGKAGEMPAEPSFKASQFLNSSPSMVGFRTQAPSEEGRRAPQPPPAYDPGLYRDAYSRLGLLRIANICDLGCGAGNFTGIMVKMNQKTEVYLGVDSSHSQISIAKAAYPGWSFLYGDFLNPQIQDQFERYEAFLMLNLLDVLEDDLSVLEIIPSGRPVLFSMPRTEKEGSKRWFNDPLSLKQRYGNFLNIRSMGRFRASEAVYSMIVGERW